MANAGGKLRAAFRAPWPSGARYDIRASRIRLCASLRADRVTLSLSRHAIYGRTHRSTCVTCWILDRLHDSLTTHKQGRTHSGSIKQDAPAVRDIVQHATRVLIETDTLPRCIQIVDPDPAAFTTPLYKADPQYQRPLHPPPRRLSAFAALAKRVSAFAAPTLAPWALPCVSRRRDLPGRT